MSLAHLLLRRALSTRSRRDLQRHRLHATHGEWAARSAGLAQRLRDAGLAPGDRVLLFMRNHPRYLEVLWGAWWAGLVVVPVNAKLHPREVEWIIDNAQARWAFVTRDVAPQPLAGPGAADRRRVGRGRRAAGAGGRRAAVPWPSATPTTWPGCSTPAAPPAGPRA